MRIEALPFHPDHLSQPNAAFFLNSASGPRLEFLATSPTHPNRVWFETDEGHPYHSEAHAIVTVLPTETRYVLLIPDSQRTVGWSFSTRRSAEVWVEKYGNGCRYIIARVEYPA